jgi:hypothetical protein
MYLCGSNQLNKKIMKTEMKVQMYGCEIEVGFFYSPAEPQVNYYSDGSGYPGCSEEFEIDTLTIGGVDVYELLYEIKDFEEKLIEELKNGN